ncbi:hypothetical protein [Halocatena halophila]|uniref:hypothetical protein n=1 Tax=Halocatena halophila TaxID=2814576 RepID=UPI002ED647F7
MNDEERADVERALERLSDRNPAQFFLKRALGKETEYEEINGHLFSDDSKWCKHGSCELMRKRKNIADKVDCPAPMEGIELHIDNKYIH